MAKKSKPDAAPDQVAKTNGRFLWTLPELAAEAKVCRRLIELEISRGRLTAVRISNRVRVRDRDWQTYLTANATTPAGAN